MFTKNITVRTNRPDQVQSYLYGHTEIVSTKPDLESPGQTLIELVTSADSEDTGRTTWHTTRPIVCFLDGIVRTFTRSTSNLNHRNTFRKGIEMTTSTKSKWVVEVEFIDNDVRQYPVPTRAAGREKVKLFREIGSEAQWAGGISHIKVENTSE